MNVCCTQSLKQKNNLIAIPVASNTLSELVLFYVPVYNTQAMQEYELVNCVPINIFLSSMDYLG